MTTAAEAYEAARAIGLSDEDARAKVDDQSVDGAYCDGTIVIDSRGKRCIPRSTLDARRAAALAAPLRGPVSPLDEPTPPSLLPVVLVLVAFVAVFLAVRR